jgi:septum formation protein
MSGNMFKTLQPLTLASESPRRKRLLQSVGLDFRIVPSRVAESGAPSGNPSSDAEKWAHAKSASISTAFPDSWVLGADTIVVVDGKIFGKPADRDEASSMLSELSGRAHDVITGICLMKASPGIYKTGSVTTKVLFKDLSRDEIEAYIRTGEPMDKAGAYGIQGIGAFLVRAIEGSYTNVVGLPLCEVLAWLMEEGVIEPVSGN